MLGSFFAASRLLGRHIWAHKVTTSLPLLGIVLVVLFPFHLIFRLTPTTCQLATSIHMFHGRTCLQIEYLGIWWDFIAVLWTAIFSISFFLVEFSRYYTGKSQRLALLSQISVVVSLVSFGLLYIGFSDILGADHNIDHYGFLLFAKAIPMGWIVVTDLIILSSKSVASWIRTDFREVMYIVDLPALFAVAILIFYFFYAGPKGSDPWIVNARNELGGFVSGASAALLVFTNIVFSMQFIRKAGRVPNNSVSVGV